MSPLDILLLVIIFLLVGAIAVLLFYCLKVTKSINIFLEKGNIKDAKDILFEEIEKTKALDADLQAATKRIQYLEGISKVSLQKIGMVRFNPFGENGGNQSFAIALLDNQNNGFVILSLLIKEGNRVYAKAITDGKSEYTLSKEEQEAIDKAIKN